MLPENSTFRRSNVGERITRSCLPGHGGIAAIVEAALKMARKVTSGPFPDEGYCRFTLIAETDRVRHFRALPETRPFRGIQIGTGGPFLYT